MGGSCYRLTLMTERHGRTVRTIPGRGETAVTVACLASSTQNSREFVKPAPTFSGSGRSDVSNK